jgi:hypothetical protein
MTDQGWADWYLRAAGRTLTRIERMQAHGRLVLAEKLALRVFVRQVVLTLRRMGKQV